MERYEIRIQRFTWGRLRPDGSYDTGVEFCIEAHTFGIEPARPLSPPFREPTLERALERTRRLSEIMERVEDNEPDDR